MTDRVKVHPNERVDLDDFEFAAKSAFNDLKSLSQAFLGDQITVIDGFDFILDSATDFRVTLGRAFAKDPDDSANGVLIVGGDPSNTVSFSGLGAATYGVWMRFIPAEGSNANRAFWDPDAGEENVQLVATRQEDNWDMQISATSPGADWVELYQVAWDGADLDTSTITDKRPTYFEGTSDAQWLGGVLQNPGVTHNSAWGAGNDRDPNRALHGIKHLVTFVSAVIKKLEEIQTGTNPSLLNERWWDTVTNSLDDMLPLSGTVGAATEMRGDIVPDTIGANYELGSSTQRWLNVYANNGFFRDLRPSGGAGTADIGASGDRYDALWLNGAINALGNLTIADILPQASPQDIGTNAAYFNAFLNNVDIYGKIGLDQIGGSSEAKNPRLPVPFDQSYDYTCIWESTDQDSLRGAIRVYVSGGTFPDFVVTCNAAFSGATAIWNRDDSGASSFRFAIGGNGMELRRRSSASADGWTDAQWTDGTPIVYHVQNGDLDVGYIDLQSSLAGTSPVFNYRLYRNNVVKAWAQMATDGVGGVTVVGNGYNIDDASLSFSGTDVVLPFFANMLNTNYVVVGNAFHTSVGANIPLVVRANTLANGSFRAQLVDSTGAVVDQQNQVCSYFIMAIGD